MTSTTLNDRGRWNISVLISNELFVSPWLAYIIFFTGKETPPKFMNAPFNKIVQLL